MLHPKRVNEKFLASLEYIVKHTEDCASQEWPTCGPCTTSGTCSLCMYHAADQGDKTGSIVIGLEPDQGGEGD